MDSVYAMPLPKATTKINSIKIYGKKMPKRPLTDKFGKVYLCDYNLKLAIESLLSCSQKKIALELLTWVDPKNPFKCQRSLKSFCKIVGRTERPVRTAMRALEAKGFIEVDQRGHLHKTNRYQLNGQALLSAAFKDIKIQKTAPSKLEKQPPTKKYILTKEIKYISKDSDSSTQLVKTPLSRSLNKMPSSVKNEFNKMADFFDEVHGTITTLSQRKKFWGNMGKRGMLKTPETALESISTMVGFIRYVETSEELKRPPPEGHSIGRLFFLPEAYNADQATRRNVREHISRASGYGIIGGIYEKAQEWRRDPMELFRYAYQGTMPDAVFKETMNQIPLYLGIQRQEYFGCGNYEYA